MRISSVGSKGSGRAPQESGVTLLELLIVISILSLMVGLVAPQIGHWLDDWKLESAAERIAQTLRYARVRALYEQRYYLVEIRENQVRVLEPASGFIREYTLPAEVQVNEEGREASSPVLRVLLPPSGAVEEKTLWVRNRPGRKLKIHLDFLLGTAGVEIAKQGS